MPTSTFPNAAEASKKNFSAEKFSSTFPQKLLKEQHDKAGSLVGLRMGL